MATTAVAAAVWFFAGNATLLEVVLAPVQPF